MDLSPLTVVVLLAFGLLIAFCLTLWTTLGNFGRASRPENGDGPVTDRRAERTVENRRSSMTPDERPTVERRQETRVRADKTTTRIRTEPTPVVLPPESPRARRQSSDAKPSGQESPVTRSSRDKVDEGGGERKPPSRSRRGKDDDDAFERFLKAKDEFDIR